MSLVDAAWARRDKIVYWAVAAALGTTLIGVVRAGYDVYRMMDPAAKRELLHDRNVERKKQLHVTKRDPFERIDDPSHHGLAPFSARNIYAPTAGGVKLHGYHVLPYSVYRELRREKPTEAFASEAFEGAIRDRPTILFFHGTGGTVAAPHRVKLYSLISMRLNCNVVAFDYRGYGLSPGTPSEQSLYEDARAAYDWYAAVLHRIAPEKSMVDMLGVVGHSLGGPISGHLVKGLQEEGVKVRSYTCMATFRNMPDLIEGILIDDWQAIATHAAWFGMKERYHRSWKERFDLEEKLKIISCPVLIVHTEGEEIINHSHNPGLVRAASSIRHAAGSETIRVDERYSVTYIPGAAETGRLIAWQGPAGSHADCIGTEVVVDMIGEIMQLQ